MMSELLCARCGEANPADARFCVECGTPLRQAVTGETVQLGGPVCQSCQRPNPQGAQFCAHCGRTIVAGPPADPVPAVPAASAPPAPPQWSGRPAGPQLFGPLWPVVVAATVVVGLVLLFGLIAAASSAGFHIPGFLPFVFFFFLFGRGRGGRGRGGRGGRGRW